MSTGDAGARAGGARTMTLPGAVRIQIAGISTQEDALAVERAGAERPDGSTDHERVRAFVAAVRSAV